MTQKAQIKFQSKIQNRTFLSESFPNLSVSSVFPLGELCVESSYLPKEFVLISSRRLAREWALKILYQIDVGKHSPEDALRDALETLRKEFVQRGSKTASGSANEAIWLNWVTANLVDTLDGLRLPFERAVSTGAGRMCEEAVYWQEVRFEKAFKTAAPGLHLSPPRLGVPLGGAFLFPADSNPADGLSVQIAQLTAAEKSRYRDFLDAMRTELPPLFDKEARKEARRFGRELAENRPIGAAVSDYLLERREAYNAESLENWRRVGAVVTKQTGDFLRTGAFAQKLVRGALEKQAEIDKAIADLSAGWKLNRQAAVDRNIMRIAGYEMLFLPAIPTGASINEAVELAKKFSTAESGKFVNGVLGALATQVGDKLAPPADAASLIEADKDEALDLPEIDLLEDSDEDNEGETEDTAENEDDENEEEDGA